MFIRKLRPDRTRFVAAEPRLTSRSQHERGDICLVPAEIIGPSILRGLAHADPALVICFSIAIGIARILGEIFILIKGQCYIRTSRDCHDTSDAAGTSSFPHKRKLASPALPEGVRNIRKVKGAVVGREES